MVRGVEGQERRLRVGWAVPHSWKERDRYHELLYELRYHTMPHGTQVCGFACVCWCVGVCVCVFVMAHIVHLACSVLAQTDITFSILSSVCGFGFTVSVVTRSPRKVSKTRTIQVGTFHQSPQAKRL